MEHWTRREVIQAGLTGLGAVAVAIPGLVEGQTANRSPEVLEFSFHHDHIVGTSLDGWIIASDPITASQAEQVVLAQIARLCRIFSTYDPQSELSRLNRTTAPTAVSPDLLSVLREYEQWSVKTSGACSAQVGTLVQLWTDAAQQNTVPSPTLLAEAAKKTSSPAWRIDSHDYVTRLNEQPLNLNSIAKGYILHQAAEAVRNQVPGITGCLLNLGGDMTAWGVSTNRWSIAVQDPSQPEENSKPLTAITLRDGSIATSGSYQRYYEISGKRHSHLIDPRTGLPATGIIGATVCAPTSVVANVLATTLCILKPAEGMRLVASVPGAECLLVTAAGQLLKSPGFAARELPLDDKPQAAKPDEKTGDKPATKSDPWPEGFQVNFALELPKPTSGRKIRRPYVAIWIEDPQGKAVRTVTVWGKQPRWVPTLTGWWKAGKGDSTLVKAVTRATRAPGKYSVVWDGKDDKGKALPQGTYNIKVEVHREHGKHVFQTGKLVCGPDPVVLTLEKNAETEATTVEYGKRK